MKLSVLALSAFAALAPSLALSAEDPEINARNAQRQLLEDAKDRVTDAWRDGSATGTWTASIVVSRNSRRTMHGGLVHVQDSLILQGLGSKDRCLAAAHLLAGQMLHVHGSSVDFAALSIFADTSLFMNPAEHSEATIICLDIATGETVTDALVAPF